MGNDGELTNLDGLSGGAPQPQLAGTALVTGHSLLNDLFYTNTISDAECIFLALTKIHSLAFVGHCFAGILEKCSKKTV